MIHHIHTLASSSCSLVNRLVASTLITFIAASVAVLAQVNLEVTVLDQGTNQPVADAMVTLSNLAIGYSTTQQTNEQGKARFSGLTITGEYQIDVSGSADEYLKAQVGGITLRANSDRTINVTLTPRKTYKGGEVTVIGNSSRTELNALNAEVSASIGQQQIEDLPVEGRDITRVLYRLPNVTQATGFFPEAPNVSINGVNSLYASYLIDGMDNNENFLGGQKFAIPVGFTHNVTVLTNNYSTEFGRTGNGVFNITTKTGNNNISGEAFYITRPGPDVIDASSPYTQRDLSGNDVRDGFQRHQAGFAVGGPIVRDRTFFYANFEQTVDFKDNLLSVPQLGISTTVPGDNTFSYGSLKLTHFWNTNWISSLRANVGLVNLERQGGGLDGGVTFPSAANSQDRNSLLIASRNMFVGEGFTYEGNIQYSRFRWNYGKPANSNSPQVVVIDSTGSADVGTLAVLGHPGYVFDDVENTVNIQQKVTFDMGNHHLKFGGELLSADFQLSGGGNPNGNYTVQLSGAQQQGLLAANNGSGLDIDDIPADVQVVYYGVELRPASFGKRQNVISLYAEDLFSLTSNLNVTLGLRYDYDNLSVGGGDKGDYDNIAPRFSFNYKLDDRSVIRGGYGIFYDKILYAIYSDALQQNSTSAGYRQQIQQLIDRGDLPADTDLDKVLFDGNVTADVFDGVTYLHGPTFDELQANRAQATSGERRILNPNGYDNPLTHQISLGYQHQLNDNTLFYVDVMHTESRNLYRLYNLNAPAAYPIDPGNVVVRTTEEADATRPIAVIEGGAKNIVMTETAGEAQYTAATVNLVKEKGNDDFGYRLSYTISRSYNNTDDINFKAQDANNFEDEWGAAINDRTHVINSVFYYYPVEDVTLSFAGIVQSGQPVNRIPDAILFGTTDLNGDGASFGDAYVGNSDRYPGVERNADRLPWAYTFDLGVQYNWHLTPESRIEVRADVFNLFNTVNLSGYSNNATQSNQIQVGPVGSAIDHKNSGAPRQFQFGVRYVL